MFIQKRYFRTQTDSVNQHQEKLTQAPGRLGWEPLVVAKAPEEERPVQNEVFVAFVRDGICRDDEGRRWVERIDDARVVRRVGRRAPRRVRRHGCA